MIKPKITLILIALFFLAFTACNPTNSNNAPANKPANSSAPAATGNVKTGVKPEPDQQVAVIETADYGRIVIELYPNLAPKQVERFKKLINEKFYDGTAIHRIDPNLGIIQGGDPVTKTGKKSMWGTGNSPYPNVPAEFNDIPYDRGTLGAARTNDINGANCQWFITLKRQPAFDKKYTVFGKVIDGLKNAEVIMTAPTEEGSERPADKVVIKSVTLQPRANFPAS
ncbi:MAG TPA: peptidylprolyl isomerase [Pyrinomonadaceae bacterium]|nr:peptidylprolyl isomerase [Pyrinomonadaceae bacterium]